MPLVLVLLMEEMEWKKAFRQLIVLSCFWAVGYIGMWALKWLICFVVLHDNIFSEVYGRITYHTGKVEIMGEEVSSLGVVWKNIKVFLKLPYMVLMIAVFAGVWLKYKKMKEAGKWMAVIPFLFISLIPLIWIWITKSHAGWCYWYTSRGLMGTAFALSVALVTSVFSSDSSSFR